MFRRAFVPVTRAVRVPASKALKASVSVRWNSSDPFLKYQEKLAQKAKERGLDSVEALREALKEDLEKKRAELGKVPDAVRIHPKEEQKTESDAEGTGAAATRGPRKDIPDLPKADIKSLDSFIDVEKLQLHDAKEIELIWKARFEHKDNQLCGAINGLTFSRIYKNARLNPSFVLPLHHEEQGVELHYAQWAFVGPYTMHCMITSVAEYKLHQEYARPHTTVMIHSNLLTDKNLALMNAAVEKDSNVSQEQGAMLVLNLQRFYGADESTDSGRRKVEMLQHFTTGSPDFSPEALITETETLD